MIMYDLRERYDLEKEMNWLLKQVFVWLINLKIGKEMKINKKKMKKANESLFGC